MNKLTFVHLHDHPSMYSTAQIPYQSCNKEDSYTAKLQVHSIFFSVHTMYLFIVFHVAKYQMSTLKISHIAIVQLNLNFTHVCGHTRVPACLPHVKF